MKKPSKGHEGQTKARKSIIPKFNLFFFMSMEPLGVIISHVSIA